MKRKIPYLLTASLLLLASCEQSNLNRDAWLADPKGHIRIASADDPQTLDPRFARDLVTVNAVINLYEGLLRKTEHGDITPGIASSFTTSDDGLSYTFTLRSAKWSNGDPVTSHHFADAWKSQLLPDSAAPNANQLYCIKNGRAVKEGKLSIEKLGIETPDDKTLTVHLETPLPYFKELISSHFFLPIHPAGTSEAPICNGPFKLDAWKKNNEIVGIKNPEYWDVDHVILDKFSFVHLEDHTALQLYDADQVDWAGSPLGLIPQDALLSLKKKQHLLTVPSAGIYWFRVNTTKEPLSNQKIRLALAYALDRAALVKNVIQGNQEAALSIVPPSLGLKSVDHFTDDDTTKAWELFEAGLAELNMTIEEFPKITILYSTAAERNQKIVQAVQHQWKKVFGEKIQLQGNESKAVFQQLGQLNYDIALGSWFADIEDPSNFLDIFTHKTNAGNNTGWDNPRYKEFMQQSLLAKTPEERNERLLEAQSLLMQEMPVIPLFFGAFNYVKKRDVSNVPLTSMGHLNFRHAFIDIGDMEQLEVMD